MSGRSPTPRVVRVGRLILQISLIALCPSLTSVGARVDADQPQPAKAAPLSAAHRKSLLAEREQLADDSKRLKAEREFGRAAQLAEKLADVDRRLFGERSPQVADTLSLLAAIHERRENWPAANQAHKEVLAIRLKLVGKDHWQTGDAQRAIEYTAALQGFEAPQRKRLWDADDWAVAVVNLVRDRRLPEAIALGQQVMDVRRAILGSRHWRLSFALNWLGRAYDLSNDWGKARRVFVEAVAIRRATLGENHPETAWSLNNLGLAQWRLKDYARARSSYEEALAVRAQGAAQRPPGHRRLLAQSGTCSTRPGRQRGGSNQLRGSS